MKISGIAVYEDTEGFGFRVDGKLGPRNIELDGTDGDALALAVNNALEAFVNGGRGPGEPMDGEVIPPTGEPAPTEGRRRRGSATETAPAQTPADTASAEAPATGTRRRRGGEAATTTAEPVPTEGRRRRGGTAAGADAGNGAAAPSPTTASPSEGRRRRTPSAEPATPQIIGDADLAKASSEAGRLVGVPAVVGVIEQYADAEGYVCENVAQIKPEDRRSFLDALTALTA